MKKEKISNALGNIDNRYIEEAADFTCQTKAKETPARTLFLRFGALAASLALVIVGTIAVMPHMQEWFGETQTSSDTPHGYVSGTDINESTEDSGGFEFIVSEQKISVIDDKRYASYVSRRVIEEKHVGEKIEDITVHSFWRHYAAENKDTDHEYLRAEIYTIKGVSTDAAVCVRYLDLGDALTTTHYYTFVNSEFEPDTLQTLFIAYDMESYLSFLPTVQIGAIDPVDSYEANDNAFDEIYTYLGTANDKLDMRLDSDAYIDLLKEELIPNHQKRALLSVSLPSAGDASAKLSIYDCGEKTSHLVVELNNIYYVFETDHAKALIENLESNTTLLKTETESTIGIGTTGTNESPTETKASTVNELGWE